MKRIIIAAVVFASLLFCGSVGAEEVDKNSLYSEQYKSSGADSLSDALPEDIANQLSEFDISSTDVSWTESLTPENIFESMLSFLKSGGKRPLVSGCSILAVLLFTASVGGLSTDNKMLKYVLNLGIAASAVFPAAGTIKSCTSAISSAGVFMLSFIPTYAAILVSRSKTATAAGFSSIMLAATEAVSWICSYLLVPMTGMQLSLAVSGSVMPEINTSSIGNAVKKASMWILSLSSTVLLGILGMQTLVRGSADSLSAKTAKFVVGTAVPVVGATVSEALATVNGCLKLLGTSVAVYAVIALALLMLPAIVELLLWRVALLICASVAEMLGQDKGAALIRAVDGAVAFILGIMILIGILFIISITVVSVA